MTKITTYFFSKTKYALPNFYCHVSRFWQKNKVVLFVIGLMAPWISQGQDNAFGWNSNLQIPVSANFGLVAPPSANASSLGKYGDIPVSYHTGVPNISIPIYTIKQGSLSLPISVNYHSSGIKVDELASWVGLGWSLNAGGVISRTVVGAPDEGNNRPYANAGVYAGNLGWYKDKGISPLISKYCLTHPNAGPDSIQGYPTNPKWANCRSCNTAVLNGITDTEPDIYNFNFAGFSGKFFFDSLQNVVMQPLQDLVIKPVLTISSDGVPYFYQWLIITPDGTHYYFGNTKPVPASGSIKTNPITAPDPTVPIEANYFGPNGGPCNNCSASFSASSWYLSKIVNMNKTDSIMLSYRNEQYSYVMPPSHSVAFIGNVLQGNLTTPGQVAAITMVNSYVPLQITTSSSNISVNFVSGQNIRQDVSSYGGYSSPSTTAAQLDAVQINEPNYQKTYNFTYDYFVGPSTPSQSTGALPGIYGGVPYCNLRLRLNRIQANSSGIYEGPYLFTYNTSIQMPNRLCFDKDHWGYYNNYNGRHIENAGLIPSFPSPVTTPDGETVAVAQGQMAIRAPDSLAMQVGILTQIQYPTGGTTQFVYQPHYQNPQIKSSFVGGLRIRQIIDNDGINPPTTTSYSYGNGILYAATLQYLTNMRFNSSNSNGVLYFPSGGGALGTDVWGVLFSGEARPAMHTTQGYHIGYSDVFVSKTSGGVGIGQSHYQYYNQVPADNSFTIQFPNMPPEYVLGTGELYSEVHSNSTGNILKSTSYIRSYDFVHNIRAVKIAGLNTTLSIVPQACVLPYYLNTGRSFLSKKTDYSDGVTTTTSYRYSPNHSSPVQVSIVDSEGIQKDLLTNYSKDNFVNACNFPIKGCSSSYNSTMQPLFTSYVAGTITDQQFDAGLQLAGNKFSSCVGSYQSYLNCLSSATGLGASDNLLKTMAVNNLIVPLGRKSKYNGIQVDGDSTAFTQSFGPLVPWQHYQFDTNLSSLTLRATLSYNAVEKVVSYTKQNDLTVAYIWGYNNTERVAEIKNALPTQVYYNSFETNTSVTKAKTGRYSLQGTMTVSAPGAGSFILSYWSSPDGNNWTYNQGTIVSGSPQTIGTTSGYLDEVRIYPLGAQMKTYTYDPGVGVTSVTDENSNTTTYQYDALGRLVAVIDNLGKVLKTYKYNYYNNNSNSNQ